MSLSPVAPWQASAANPVTQRIPGCPATRIPTYRNMQIFKYSALAIADERLVGSIGYLSPTCWRPVLWT